MLNVFKDMQVLIGATIFTALPFLISSVDSSCPSACNCTSLEVICINKDLEKIPHFDELENSPLVMDLSGNKIALIGPDEFSFEKSDMVKELYLNNSEVIDIDTEAFDDMESLQGLYLSDNLLRVIPENLLDDLPNIVLLDLSGNPFEGQMPVIRSKSLEVLLLANCQITEVTSEALNSLPNLRLLILSENNIQYINPEVFESLTESFSLRLAYNNWACNCKTIHLFNYLTKKNYIDLSEQHQCTFNQKIIDIQDFQSSKQYVELCNDTRDNNDQKQRVDKRNSIKTTKEQNTTETRHENVTIQEKNNVKSIQIDDLSVRIFLISITSFSLGIFFGYLLNQFASVKHQLETSDSTSKLIIS